MILDLKIPKMELSYIAGFLDGDGSIIAQLIRREDYKLGFQIRVSIQFSQKCSKQIYLEKGLLSLKGKQTPVGQLDLKIFQLK